MNIALIIIYVLTATGLLLAAYKHGDSRDNYSFWGILFSTIINLVLIWWALGWRFI